jgi:hypothetical protein
MRQQNKAVSSAGLRPKSDCSGKAQMQLYSKLQTRPLVREGATKQQSRSCLQKISWRKKNWSKVPDGRLTVGRKLTQLNSTQLITESLTSCDIGYNECSFRDWKK